MLKLWCIERAAALTGNVNKILFFLFLPEKGNLSIIDRMVYRGLVKMVILEKRLDRALERCFRSTSIRYLRFEMRTAE
ncbi:MAG TPA: hypothetical protein PK544_03185 [Spirochaetota bacterium]|nr:hypothetical protein [Spirochaetota bacterium]HPJ39668.1 hypothetical protein [Spirochaetota bacterium]HPQ55067.1 hypothetical protein [Spirochaetota bacterium]